jgi:hypothetical protein
LQDIYDIRTKLQPFFPGLQHCYIDIMFEI